MCQSLFVHILHAVGYVNHRYKKVTPKSCDQPVTTRAPQKCLDARIVTARIVTQGPAATICSNRVAVDSDRRRVIVVDVERDHESELARLEQNANWSHAGVMPTPGVCITS